MLCRHWHGCFLVQPCITLMHSVNAWTFGKYCVILFNSTPPKLKVVISDFFVPCHRRWWISTTGLMEGVRGSSSVVGLSVAAAVAAVGAPFSDAIVQTLWYEYKKKQKTCQEKCGEVWIFCKKHVRRAGLKCGTLLYDAPHGVGWTNLLYKRSGPAARWPQFFVCYKISL